MEYIPAVLIEQQGTYLPIIKARRVHKSTHYKLLRVLGEV
jgi:hypothetical protein